MEAQDYLITLRYGSTKPPYSPEHPHRGNDRRMPVGTPVVVCGVTIGLSGNTGLSTGPHLHTQAGTDPGCQNTVDPAPYEFEPGIVTNTGTGPQWGKFVTIQVGSHYITYAHLSEVNVKVGQKITEDDMYKGKTAEEWYDLYQVTLKTANSRKDRLLKADKLSRATTAAIGVK